MRGARWHDKQQQQQQKQQQQQQQQHQHHHLHCQSLATPSLHVNHKPRQSHARVAAPLTRDTQLHH